MSVATQLEQILRSVSKPSRYLGTEVNAVHKDPAQVDIRMALAFPDLYDLGLGNLGLHILYGIVNDLPWAWCERTYAPAVDMEAELRKADVSLFALESKAPLIEMDCIGFTLQSELTYTNILNMLDLSGIPLRTEERGEEHPLTCAGGPAVFNPEPIAPFMDFFVIGDGEDVIVEICEVLREGGTRSEKLAALAKIDGIYVPTLYPFDTLPDGRVLPAVDAPPIIKRTVSDLGAARYPADAVVPFAQQVHDRASLEVLRGCTQGCRFCQAGMTTRPVRERSLDDIDHLMKKMLDETGYGEVSLVSLSTCDYSRVQQMVENAVDQARPRRVSVSLPSLRLDSFSVELADMVAETRRTGLTVAPEAASPRLRSVINKFIPDDDLLDMSRGAFKRGWKHVKLYFMIGLPTERDEDIEAIADLSIRTVEVGREFRSTAKVNLGVSTFVPKPFTPFQWAQQIPMEETVRRQKILSKILYPHRAIKFGRHEPEETFLEGLVSRSDRRAADLLEAAFRKGCRFDAWREHLRFDLWQEAIEETGFDVEDAMRERDLDERLPWDHLDVHIPKSWFQADWKRALQLKWAPDCRARKCHKCGVIDVKRKLCATMLRDHVKGRVHEAKWERKERPPYQEPAPVQRLWFRVSRTEGAKWLSHLEATNAWIRALRRAAAPLSYSQGFHPHPKVAFSSAMPQNQESLGEYMDITLKQRVEPAEFMDVLRKHLPTGFGVAGVKEVPLRAPSLMFLARGAQYRIELPDTAEEVASRVDALRNQTDILVERRSKKKKNKGRTRTLNIRPSIRHIETDGATVQLTITETDGVRAKPREILGMLTGEPQGANVLRTETLTEREGAWMSIFESITPDNTPMGASE